MSPLEVAIKTAGGVAALAAAVNSAPSAPSMWKARGNVPTEHCPAIERATLGGVTCEDLRPDAKWFRASECEWPWHPRGKPMLDVLASEVGGPPGEGASADAANVSSSARDSQSASALIDLLGGTAAVAALFDIKPPSVSEWRAKGIPQDKLARLAPEAERASCGRLICEAVCVGVRWLRVPDPEWPFHPDGRPLIDVMRPPAQLSQTPGLPKSQAGISATEAASIKRALLDAAIAHPSGPGETADPVRIAQNLIAAFRVVGEATWPRPATSSKE